MEHVYIVFGVDHLRQNYVVKVFEDENEAMIYVDDRNAPLKMKPWDVEPKKERTSQNEH